MWNCLNSSTLLQLLQWESPQPYYTWDELLEKTQIKFLIQAHVWEVGRITSESNWELRNFRCHGEQRKRKELPETEQGCGQIKLLSRVRLCWPRQEGLDRSHEGLLLLPLLLRLVISILSNLSLPYWFKLDLWDKWFLFLYIIKLKNHLLIWGNELNATRRL